MGFRSLGVYVSMGCLSLKCRVAYVIYRFSRISTVQLSVATFGNIIETNRKVTVLLKQGFSTWGASPFIGGSILKFEKIIIFKRVVFITFYHSI